MTFIKMHGGCLGGFLHYNELLIAKFTIISPSHATGRSTILLILPAPPTRQAVAMFLAHGPHLLLGLTALVVAGPPPASQPGPGRCQVHTRSHISTNRVCVWGVYLLNTAIRILLKYNMNSSNKV